MSGSRVSIAIFGSLLTAACAKKSAPPTTPISATPVSAPATAPPAAAEPAPVSPHVGASGDLIAQCKLKFANTQEAPKFGLDEAELLPADRNALDQVAVCLTRGPLQGRAVKLVGRADPRGTEEYNLGLGARRAGSVASYLQRLGVPTSQLRETTRGAVDARGADEAGWRADRRVDLELVSSAPGS